MKFLGSPGDNSFFTWMPVRGQARFIGEGRVGFMHAHKGGAPVLKEGSTWRTISGVYLNTRWGWLAVQFRGFHE